MDKTNEAAERLREHLSNLTTERVYSVAWLDALDEALAAERRATVERIRAALNAVHLILRDDLSAILDEEAAR